MSEVILDIPEDLDLDDEMSEDERKALISEAFDALAKAKKSKAKARERRANMSEEEKMQAAENAKRRRAKIALMVKFAEKQNYEPSDDEVDAYLAAQE